MEHAVPAPVQGVRPDRRDAALLLACILSDSLKFRSPTTTPADVAMAHELALLAQMDLDRLGDAMLEAKSDTSALSAAELLLLDSKVYELQANANVRISVIETVNGPAVLRRREELRQARSAVLASEPDVKELLLFVVDILEEAAYFVGHSDRARQLERISAAFPDSRALETDAAVLFLPGVLSRKKQIVPQLLAAVHGGTHGLF